MKIPFKIALVVLLVARTATIACAQQQSQQNSLDDAINGLESTTHSVRGVPNDLSHHHLIFSRPTPGSQNDFRVKNNPRYWIQQIQRSLPADTDWNTSNAFINGVAVQAAVKKIRAPKATLHRDWSQSLGTDGTAGAEMFPAKFSFTTGTAPNCASATNPDYVAFNTSLGGSASQASLIAFDNLYATTCSGTVPLTYWAYNTGGTASTSVALSLDGSQIAFVQSVGTTANLVLLKWRKSPATHNVTALRTNGSPTLVSTGFVQGDVGAHIGGTGIPTNTYITAVTATTVTMSNNASSGTLTSTTIAVNAETVAAPGVPPTVTAANYRSCNAPCMTTFAFTGTPNDTNSAPFPDYDGDIIYVGADNGKLFKFSGVFSGTPSQAGSPWPVTVHSSTVLSSPVFDGANSILVGDASGRASFVNVAGALEGTAVQIGASGSVIVDAPLVDGSTLKALWYASLTKSSGPNTLTDYVVQTTTSLGSAVTLTIGNNDPDSTNPGHSHSGAFDNLYLNSAPSRGFMYFCGVRNGWSNHPSLFRVGFTSNGTMNTTVGSSFLEISSPSVPNECSPLTEFVNGSTDRLFVSVEANGQLTGCSDDCIYSFTPAVRTVNNAVTNGTTTVTSATAAFVSGDVGSAVTGTNIPVGATIVTRNSSTSITISAAASGSGSGGNLNIVGFPADASAGLSAQCGTSGIIIDNSSSSTGASQVYYSPLGGGAVQASQSGLN